MPLSCLAAMPCEAVCCTVPRGRHSLAVSLEGCSTELTPTRCQRHRGHPQSIGWASGWAETCDCFQTELFLLPGIICGLFRIGTLPCVGHLSITPHLTSFLDEDDTRSTRWHAHRSAGPSPSPKPGLVPRSSDICVCLRPPLASKQTLRKVNHPQRQNWSSGAGSREPLAPFLPHEAAQLPCGIAARQLGISKRGHPKT